MKKLIFHSYVSLPEGTNLIFPASKKVANHKQVPGMASPSTFVIFEATDKKKNYILVGGFNHLENMKVSWDYYSHILWNIKHVPNHQPDIIQ